MTKAIILAAGKGTRLLPYTLTKHKAFIEINNKPIIEYLVEQLIAQNIKEIVVVVGHLSEQFKYLTKKYNVKLISNDKFNEYNNFYSVYLAREYLSDSFIIEGDVFVSQFDFKTPTHSTYYVKNIKTSKQEWIVKSASSRRIHDITVDYVTDEDEISAGITYLNDNDGVYLKQYSEALVDYKELLPLIHWDQMLINNLSSLNLYSKCLPMNEVFEIDDIADLNEARNWMTEREIYEVI